MKRLPALALSLVLALSFAGCGQSGETGSSTSELSSDQSVETEPVATAPEPIDDPWGLALTASDVTSTGLTLTFTQSGGAPTGQLIYGSEYWLEQETEDGWTAVPDILDPDKDYMWTLEAYHIPMNDRRTQQVNWSRFYGELVPGHYRIAKEIMDFRASGDYDETVYYAEFDVE